MADLFNNLGGLWWRFSAYKFQDGYLCPAEGAQLERYDPWAVHQAARSDGDPDPLGELLRFVGDHAGPLPDVAAALEWSRKYGPLGVLPYRTAQIVLAPQADPTPTPETRVALERMLSAAHGSSPDFDARAALQEQMDRNPFHVIEYRYGAGGWFSNRLTWPQHTDADEWREQHAPHALMRSEFLIRPELSRVSVSEGWGRYFPSVPPEQREGYAYPGPGTDEFAGLYREPFIEWASWALKLSKAVGALSRERDAQTGSVMLGQLAQGTSPRLAIDENQRKRLEWGSPALLSALALMAMQRLAGGRDARVCKDPQCGAVFLPINRRAEYHEDRCRWRHRKETQRTAAREKKARRARAGRSKRNG